MTYQVARDGKTIGSFTDEELIEAVEAGTILDTDDAWCEGMEDWVTVESLIEDEDDEADDTPVDTPTVKLAKPTPVPLGKHTASGHAPTSHYYTAPTASAPPPVRAPATPTHHSPAMPLRQAPPMMVKGGLDALGGRYGTAGAAIASIVLGIMALLGGITAIPAIICGHMALDKIHRTQGAFTGRGIEIAGLTMGYVTLVIWVMYLIVRIILPMAIHH